MTNVNDLRNELLDNFDRLKHGKMEIKEAAEMNNTAGKIMQTVMVELKEAEIIQSRSPIPFLRYDQKQIKDKGQEQLAS